MPSAQQNPSLLMLHRLKVAQDPRAPAPGSGPLQRKRKLLKRPLPPTNVAGTNDKMVPQAPQQSSQHSSRINEIRHKRIMRAKCEEKFENQRSAQLESMASEMWENRRDDHMVQHCMRVLAPQDKKQSIRRPGKIRPLHVKTRKANVKALGTRTKRSTKPLSKTNRSTLKAQQQSQGFYARTEPIAAADDSTDEKVAEALRFDIDDFVSQTEDIKMKNGGANIPTKPLPLPESLNPAPFPVSLRRKPASLKKGAEDIKLDEMHNTLIGHARDYTRRKTSIGYRKQHEQRLEQIKLRHAQRSKSGRPLEHSPSTSSTLVSEDALPDVNRTRQEPEQNPVTSLKRKPARLARHFPSASGGLLVTMEGIEHLQKETCDILDNEQRTKDGRRAESKQGAQENTEPEALYVHGHVTDAPEEESEGARQGAVQFKLPGGPGPLQLEPIADDESTDHAGDGDRWWEGERPFSVSPRPRTPYERALSKEGRKGYFYDRMRFEASCLRGPEQRPDTPSAAFVQACKQSGLLPEPLVCSLVKRGGNGGASRLWEGAEDEAADADWSMEDEGTGGGEALDLTAPTPRNRYGGAVAVAGNSAAHSAALTPRSLAANTTDLSDDEYAKQVRAIQESSDAATRLSVGGQQAGLAYLRNAAGGGKEVAVKGSKGPRFWGAKDEDSGQEELSLDLRGYRLGDKLAHAIGESLSTITGVMKSVDLSHNRLSDRGLQGILRQLTQLQTRTNEQRQRMATGESAPLAPLAAITPRSVPPGHQGIRLLDLSHNSVGRFAIANLSTMLRCSFHLTHLNLESTRLGDEHSRVLCEALCATMSVSSLNLNRCGVGTKAVAALANLVADNELLTELRLAWNNIGVGEDNGEHGIGHATARESTGDAGSSDDESESGAAAGADGDLDVPVGVTDLILAFSHNSSLKLLDLSWNSIGSGRSDGEMQFISVPAVHALADYVENTMSAGLLHLDLSHNQFSYADTSIFAEGLLTNHSLYSLKFDGNNGFIDTLGYLHPVVEVEGMTISTVAEMRKQIVEAGIAGGTNYMAVAKAADEEEEEGEDEDEDEDDDDDDDDDDEDDDDDSDEEMTKRRGPLKKTFLQVQAENDQQWSVGEGARRAEVDQRRRAAAGVLSAHTSGVAACDRSSESATCVDWLAQGWVEQTFEWRTDLSWDGGGIDDAPSDGSPAPSRADGTERIASVMIHLSCDDYRPCKMAPLTDPTIKRKRSLSVDDTADGEIFLLHRIVPPGTLFYFFTLVFAPAGANGFSEMIAAAAMAEAGVSAPAGGKKKRTVAADQPNCQMAKGASPTHVANFVEITERPGASAMRSALNAGGVGAKIHLGLGTGMGKPEATRHIRSADKVESTVVEMQRVVDAWHVVPRVGVWENIAVEEEDENADDLRRGSRAQWTLWDSVFKSRAEESEFHTFHEDQTLMREAIKSDWRKCTHAVTPVLQKRRAAVRRETKKVSRAADLMAAKAGKKFADRDNAGSRKTAMGTWNAAAKSAMQRNDSAGGMTGLGLGAMQQNEKQLADEATWTEAEAEADGLSAVFEEHFNALVGVFRYYSAHFKSSGNDRCVFQQGLNGFLSLCSDAMLVPQREQRNDSQPNVLHPKLAAAAPDDNETASNAGSVASVATVAGGAEPMQRNDVEVFFIASANDKVYKKARFEVEEARKMTIRDHQKETDSAIKMKRLQANARKYRIRYMWLWAAVHVDLVTGVWMDPPHDEEGESGSESDEGHEPQQESTANAKSSDNAERPAHAQLDFSKVGITAVTAMNDDDGNGGSRDAQRLWDGLLFTSLKSRMQYMQTQMAAGETAVKLMEAKMEKVASRSRAHANSEFVQAVMSQAREAGMSAFNGSGAAPINTRLEENRVTTMKLVAMKWKGADMSALSTDSKVLERHEFLEALTRLALKRYHTEALKEDITLVNEKVEIEQELQEVLVLEHDNKRVQQMQWERWEQLKNEAQEKKEGASKEKENLAAYEKMEQRLQFQIAETRSKKKATLARRKMVEEAMGPKSAPVVKALRRLIEEDILGKGTEHHLHTTRTRARAQRIDSTAFRVHRLYKEGTDAVLRKHLVALHVLFHHYSTKMDADAQHRFGAAARTRRRATQTLISAGSMLVAATVAVTVMATSDAAAAAAKAAAAATMAAAKAGLLATATEEEILAQIGLGPPVQDRFMDMNSWTTFLHDMGYLDSLDEDLRSNNELAAGGSLAGRRWGCAPGATPAAAGGMTAREVASVLFLESKMLTSDSAHPCGRVLSFVEFMEAVCRMAELKSISTEDLNPFEARDRQLKQDRMTREGRRKSAQDSRMLLSRKSSNSHMGGAVVSGNDATSRAAINDAARAATAAASGLEQVSKPAAKKLAVEIEAEKENDRQRKLESIPLDERPWVWGVSMDISHEQEGASSVAAAAAAGGGGAPANGNAVESDADTDANSSATGSVDNATPESVPEVRLRSPTKADFGLGGPSAPGRLEGVLCHLVCRALLAVQCGDTAGVRLKHDLRVKGALAARPARWLAEREQRALDEEKEVAQAKAAEQQQLEHGQDRGSGRQLLQVDMSSMSSAQLGRRSVGGKRPDRLVLADNGGYAVGQSVTSAEQAEQVETPGGYARLAGLQHAPLNKNLSAKERVIRRRTMLVVSEGVGHGGSPRMRRVAKILMKQQEFSKNARR
jgi:hypothetical protein